MAAGEETPGHPLRHASVRCGAGSARGPPGEAERALCPPGCCGGHRAWLLGRPAAGPPQQGHLPRGTSFQMILEHPGALDGEAADRHTFTRLRGSRPLTPTHTHSHPHSSLTHSHTRTHTTHMHVCVHARTHNTHAHVCACARTQMHTTHMHTCVHVHAHRCTLHTAHVSTCTHKRTLHTCTYTTHMHACADTCITPLWARP